MQIRQDFQKPQRWVFNWLIIGCVSVASMVVVGGITRLTQSGLSMVTWEPIIGIIPPLSEQEWQSAFDLYKTSPEYIHYNQHFNLSDFKQIFFWEYLHRLLGRIIGLIFIIPCTLFWRKGLFSNSIKNRILIILLLGMMQGLMGWLMVKSGLVDIPHVSHFRLAAHLLLACALIVYIYKTALLLKYQCVYIGNKTWKKLLFIFWILLILQITYGAFVAGLKAGLVYTTFPKLNGSWIPKEMITVWNRDHFNALLNNTGWVQLLHRVIGTIVLAYSIFLGILCLKSSLKQNQKMMVHVMMILLVIQFMLGIFTLLFAVPITLGVIHQVMAIVIVVTLTRTRFTFNS